LPVDTKRSRWSVVVQAPLPVVGVALTLGVRVGVNVAVWTGMAATAVFVAAIEVAVKFASPDWAVRWK
jgi:hypothetical protein